jgi:ATP-dependent helicase/nuclease subunit B
MTNPGKFKASDDPAVFTIPPGLSFVDALAAGIRADVGEEPAALAAIRILLPTRRACRALAEAFLRQSGGRPLLLPRMTPLGDIDEDELALDDPLGAGLAADAMIEPAISGMRRQLLLARLVFATRMEDVSADQAARLAAELARLLDQVHTERLDFERLPELAPQRFAEHWQTTLEFLAIVTQWWPRIVAEEGCIDPADRRNRLLEAQARNWRDAPLANRVIAAGSTGSIPATAELLEVVARLPNGSLVLPGLDVDADDETWAALEPSHPQFGMAQLLKRIGIDRRQVKPWPTPEMKDSRPVRAALINHALRPAATADRGRHTDVRAAHGLRGIGRIDAPGPEEEARSIALIMRETLEQPGKTVALVTPDRTLARRVACEMERWNVAVDDSAGRPLADTPTATFLRLTARMVVDQLAPVSLLAALKHPLAAAGLPAPTFRARVRNLEQAALRGPRPAPGLSGLEAMVDKENTNAMDVVRRLAAAIEPMTTAVASGKARIRNLLSAHTEMSEHLAATDVDPGAARLWAGEAGESAASFVAELNEAAEGFEPLDVGAYPALLDVLLTGRVVRPRYGRHPRVAIWGPLEARLQHADVMILGGLNEDTWPPKAHASPWMSRPMMRDFGLPLPERRIGLSAHDFTQAFSAPEVWLTRAIRVDREPTTPCRWLLRLENYVRGDETKSIVLKGAERLSWQSSLDRPKQFRPIERPQPRPPVQSRPRKLSVTQVETWMRDPYSIYARHILGLKALDPLEADPTSAEYGALIHKALDRFVREHPRELPPDAHGLLLAIGRRVFGDLLDLPAIRAFWWPRFERIARWFVDVEKHRRFELTTSATEVQGQIVLDAPAGPFHLTAIADRIDSLADESLTVIDYKTGAPPTEREIEAGFAPQLPLEAAIAQAGGFNGIGPKIVSALEYWRLRGGDPAGERRTVNGEASTLANRARDGLGNLVARFDLEETPYQVRPRPAFAPRFSDYEHLARVKEWSAGGGDEE